MLQNYKILPLFFFISLGSLLALFLLSNGHIFIAIFAFLLSILSALIFSKKDAYAFRFLYPGIITFTLFMTLPIVFTVYIGFTNLSTGHYLSQDQVTESLLQEKYIKAQSPILNFTLHPDGKSFAKLKIIVSSNDQTLGATFLTASSQKQVILLPIEGYPTSRKLLPHEVYRLRENLKDFQFKVPNGEIFQYFRTNKLANFAPTYHLQTNSDQVKLEKYNGQTFRLDLENGNFVDDKTNEKLQPGFFVPVGLRNFKQLLKDQNIRGPFWEILKWTFSWGFFSVVLTFLFGMTLAIVLNEKNLFGKKIYRTLFVIPYSIPFFISVLIFRGMLNKDFGIINEVLASIGITSKIAWLEVPFLAKISCLLVNLWLGFPYMFLVTTGILQSIPASIYEAAKLDGAKTWTTFKCITLPLVMKAIGPILIGSFAFNLNNFIGIYLLTGGGPPIPGSTTPAGSTDILISYTYRLAFEGGQGQNFGLASSISILIFLAISVITFFNFKFTGMNQEESRS